MILYHGSTIRVEMPELRGGVSLLDFGAGFYTTSSYEQAERWARIKMRRENAHVGAVSAYEFDFEKAQTLLRIRRFMTADRAWLDFVVQNRRGAAPVSAFSTAARTWSPSWEKITPKRAMSSCMRPSFLRQTAPVCPLDTVHGRRRPLRPRTRIAFSPAIGPHYIIIWGKHKSKPVSALAPQAPTVLHW